MRRDKTEIDESKVWDMYAESPESAHSCDNFWEFVDRMIEEDELEYDYDTGKFYRGII